jgi:hypothetical protein
LTLKIQSKSQQTTSKPTSILLQDASSPHQQAKQCNTSAHVFVLYDNKQTNQKEWHIATNSYIFIRFHFPNFAITREIFLFLGGIVKKFRDASFAKIERKKHARFNPLF